MNLLSCLFQSPYPVFIALAFAVWSFSLRGFIFDQVALSSDALAYYEHFKFFTDQLSRGVYPLWNPTQSQGIPFEFFLRRIGSYNPFISLILVYKMVGIPYTQAYLLFLVSYFFVGMTGFFLLAKSIFKDPLAAYAAFLILLFSSLGTRLFDSYILFTFIPMVWFFYLLVQFVSSPGRRHLLGLTWTLMILVTTYIPFYFLTIAIISLVLFILFYVQESREIFQKVLHFLKSNKIFAALCLFLFLVSLVPGIKLYQSMKGEAVIFQEEGEGHAATQVKSSPSQPNAEIVLPMRNYKAGSGSALEVSYQMVTEWATVEDIAYAGYFSNLRDFDFAVLYLPVVAYLVILLGGITSVNKKFLLLFSLAGAVFLLSSPEVSPAYDFLREHVFYFKYFRNLHFFLWLFILPVCALFIGQQLDAFLKIRPANKKQGWILLGVILMFHGGFIIFEKQQGGGLVTSYWAVILSFAFFFMCYQNNSKRNNTLKLTLLLLAVCIQPMEVFSYLANNVPQRERYEADSDIVQPYRYEREPYMGLILPRDPVITTAILSQYAADPQTLYAALKNKNYINDQGLAQPNYEGMHNENPGIYNLLKEHFQYAAYLYDSPDVGSVLRTAEVLDRKHYAAYWLNEFYEKMNPAVFEWYLRGSVSVYDHIENIPHETDELERIGKSFLENRHVAFTHTDQDRAHSSEQEEASYQIQVITDNTKEVEIVNYGANSLKMKTSFLKDKFLVYNDSYHSDWRAYINDQEVPLYRANIAFKGVWLPAGENTVYFRFGSAATYLFNYLMMAIFYAVFFCLVLMYIKSNNFSVKPSHD